MSVVCAFRVHGICQINGLALHQHQALELPMNDPEPPKEPEAYPQVTEPPAEQQTEPTLDNISATNFSAPTPQTQQDIEQLVEDALNSSAACLRPTLEGEDEINAVQFSHDFQTIAVATDTGVVKSFESQTGKTLTEYRHRRAATCVCFSQNNEVVFSGGRDGYLRGFHYTARKKFKSVAHPKAIQSCASNCDNTLIASGCLDAKVRIFSLDDWSLLHVCDRSSTMVQSVTFAHQNPSSIYYAGFDSHIRFWQLPPTTTKAAESLPTHREYPKLHHGNVSCLAISQDDLVLASGSWDKTINIFKLNTTWEHEQTLKGHKNWIRALCFSQDGSVLVSACDDCICVWETSSGRLLLVTGVGLHLTHSCAITPMGQLVTAGAIDFALSVDYDEDDGRELLHTSRTRLFSPSPPPG
eukprot:m.62734 g.62734  ORF g.62734 m.62734 type:complete len:412 (-) comp19395_c0_seq3:43-1278(-)